MTSNPVEAEEEEEAGDKTFWRRDEPRRSSFSSLSLSLSLPLHFHFPFILVRRHCHLFLAFMRRQAVKIQANLICKRVGISTFYISLIFPMPIFKVPSIIPKSHLCSCHLSLNRIFALLRIVSVQNWQLVLLLLNGSSSSGCIILSPPPPQTYRSHIITFLPFHKSAARGRSDVTAFLPYPSSSSYSRSASSGGHSLAPAPFFSSGCPPS
jgi:hypothetical protein